MNTERLLLVPRPKRMNASEDVYLIKRDASISIPAHHKEDLFFTATRLQEAISDAAQVRPGIVLGRRGKSEPDILFEHEAETALSPEGYTIQITAAGIRISYGSPAGAFHAVSTIKQLLRQRGKVLPCLTVEDEPEFASRGMMFDISRNKVPTMDTLFLLADTMADLKMNQLQLYIEGFSFAYPSYPEVWQTGTPLTGEELMELDRYCRNRFIDLVPNQNSFGHMDAWLARKEFADLAECPGGYWYNDTLFLSAGTLNPADPRSIELVVKMQDDLLPYFSSSLYNVCFDETYELGKGRNSAAAAQAGAGRLYLDFLLKVYQAVKRRGKRMMFWGDIIIQYPELIADLPGDAIALEWGYEADHPFHEHCEQFHRAGVPFYVCPGTSCWNSVVGRTDNMKQNLLNAAVHGRAFGAIGYLNTHWYDIAGMNHFPFVFGGLAYGAAVSWNVDNNRDMDIAAYLDRFVFDDRNEVMGGITLDLGNTYLLEQRHVHDGSVLGRMFYKDLEDWSALRDLSADDFRRIAGFVGEQERRLATADMRCIDAALTHAEFQNAIDLLLLACKLGEVKCLLQDNSTNKGISLDTGISPRLEEWITATDLVLSDYKRLWLARNRWSHGYVKNRTSGLEESAGFLQKLQRQCRELLDSMEKSGHLGTG